MTVINLWVGGLSHDSARVTAKLSGVTSARLAVDTDDAFGDPVFFDPIDSDGEGVRTFAPSSLSPGAEYFYAVEEDSVVETGTKGRFRTFSGEADTPVSHSFAVWADTGSSPDHPDTTGNVLASNRVSNSPTLDTIREHAADLDFTVCLGDITYYDLGSGLHGITGGGSIENHRRQIDDVLLQSRWHELVRTIPTERTWDDHDVGPNGSDGTLPTKGNAAQAHREKIPSWNLPDAGGALYRSKQVGRVLYVMLDCRYYRSPNGQIDGPNKTMLGTAQKAWLESLLTSSTAEALVVFSPVAWLTDSGGDGWRLFPTERTEIGNLFVSTGWADRMVMISADWHALAFDSGSHNVWGGFPCYVTAPVDSSPGPGSDDYDVGVANNREQYGVFRVSDSGSDITIIADGYEDTTLVMSHTLVISTAVEPEPEPEPEEPGAGLAQVATAQIRTRLTWLACNLSDGVLIEELPDLDGDEVSRVIGEYTSANLSLPIPSMDVPNTVPADERLAAQALLARKATEPRRTMIVCVINDVPTYAGIPLPRDLGTDADIPLGLVSLEGYLRHRYIGDHTYNEQDVALIADGILRDAGDTDDGQGIGLIIDAPNTGVIASREYLDIDDQPVYDGLSELMDAGLIEWTIDVDWRDGFKYRIVDKIARVRGRLGRSGAPQTIFQSATFSSEGGSSASYLLKEDYSGDGYANVVRLSGAGEGVDQPRSAPAIDQAQLDSGVPVWELRDSAPQTVTQQALLDLHAERLLDRVRSGARTLEIVARWDAPGARYGVDWSMGDDVGHELKGHAHPGGLNGARRAIGFALSIQRGTIRPILQEDL